MPSTQPDYTFNLSEWEHQEFKRQAKRRNEAFASEIDRLESKAATIRLIDEIAPTVAFQQRRTMAALHVSDTVKRLSGVVASRPLPVELPGMAPMVEQKTVETERRDAGVPIGATGRKERSGKKRAARRVAAPVNDGARGGNFQEDLGDVDFDAVPVDGDGDLGIGREDPLDLPENAGDAA